MKKGLILEFASTAAVAIIAMAILMAGLFTSLVLSVSSGKIENRFEYLNVLNRPYILADVLTNVKVDDRLLTEHAIETIATGSTEGAGSDLALLKSFLDNYRFDVYSISIHNRTNGILFKLDAFGKKCGASDEGVCVRKLQSMAGPCGVGRVEIADVNDVCSDSFISKEVCCKEDAAAYESQPDAFNVYECGDGGVCTSNVLDTGIPYCGQGRIYDPEGKDDCEDKNDGKTPACCIPFDEEQTRYTGAAELPLLFKGKTLYEPKTYFCQDYQNDRMSCEGGAYVNNECGSANIKCCINEPIHCKPPYEKFYCMDRELYSDKCIVIPDGECPGQANVVCCETEAPVIGTAANPPSIEGVCKLEGEPYGTTPAFGIMRVVISER